MSPWNASGSAYSSYGRWVSTLLVGLLTTTWLIYVYPTPQSMQQPFTITQHNNSYDDYPTEAKRIAIISKIIFSM